MLGLDYHVALLWNDGQSVQMCHSSYLGTAKALCEDAETSPAMESNYRVTGKLTYQLYNKRPQGPRH